MNWKPFPKQERALTLPASKVNEILFGGARGPGKTDAGMVWLLGEDLDDDGHTYIHHPRYRALVLRRDYDDLSDWLDRVDYMYHTMGAKVGGRPATVKFPSGAFFRAGYLKNKSYNKYLGHEYHRVLIEELTQIGEEKDLDHILGSNRSTVDGLRPQAFFTTNPPGVGHLWVKERYVDPSPYNKIFTGKDGRKRIYIPATMVDNPILIEKDPEYVAFIEGLKDKDPDLYRAWRHGDWDVMAGQYFKTYRRDLHTTDRFEPKPDLKKYGGVDWGRRNPFCFLAGAVQKVGYVDPKSLNEFEFNRMWLYRELYGTEKDPHEWARLIKKAVNLNEFNTPPRADPKMFHRLDDGSRSIASQFQEEGVILTEANNDRLAGWEAVKNWMSIAPDGLPYLIIGEQCENLIREIPAQVHDETNEEDLDTSGVEHAVDALRYLLIHVKWIDAGAGTISRPKPKDEYPLAYKKRLIDPSKFRD